MLRPVIVFLALLTVPLRANLGDTVQQCVGRYGAPVGYSEASSKFPFGTVAFAATGYTLIIFVLNNKEVGARVSKVNKSAFTPADMQLILNADAAVSPWNSTASSDPTCLTWSRADNATVLYDKVNHVMIFTTPAMKNAVHSAKPAPVQPAAQPAVKQ